MDQTGCSRIICRQLRRLGVSPGDTILVHSSFKSLGRVPGGIETVIQGLLGAIGKNGTLMMPGLSWSLRPPDIFDVKQTPSNVGAIPEYFRTRENTLRSIHPTHSVCATGKHAEDFLLNHEADCTPCGVNSPFHKITERGGKIVMLGCGLKPNTTMHAIEERIMPPYLPGPEYMFTIRDYFGRKYRKEYITHGFRSKGYIQRYDRITELNTSCFLEQGRVLAASAYLLHGPGFQSAVIDKLRHDPFFFVDKAPVAHG
jgi:aminoglycoside 3-N-acetyltransferase